MGSARCCLTYAWLLLALDACFAHDNTHALSLAHQIWYAPQRSPSGSIDQVVYVVSFLNTATPNSLFAPFATLHSSNQATADETCFVCRQDSAAESTKSRSSSDISPYLEYESANSRVERNARLWNQVDTVFGNSAQYFVFIDFSNGWSKVTTNDLLEFQQALVLHQPAVAVPFHTCNAVYNSSDSIATI